MKIKLRNNPVKLNLDINKVQSLIQGLFEADMGEKKDGSKKPTFPMDYILFKFPNIKKVLTELLTVTFRNYIENIYVMAPKPTTFKVVLKNKQDFLIIYNERSYIVKISGKKYYLLNLNEKQRAIHSIADLLNSKKFITSKTDEEEDKEKDSKAKPGRPKGSGSSGSSSGGSSTPSLSDLGNETDAVSGSKKKGDEGEEDLPDLPDDLGLDNEEDELKENFKIRVTKKKLEEIKVINNPIEEIKVRGPLKLVVGEIYRFKDYGDDEWRNNYEYDGRRYGNHIFLDLEGGPNTTQNLEYSDEDIQYLIKDKRIEKQDEISNNSMGDLEEIKIIKKITPEMVAELAKLWNIQQRGKEGNINLDIIKSKSDDEIKEIYYHLLELIKKKNLDENLSQKYFINKNIQKKIANIPPSIPKIEDKQEVKNLNYYQQLLTQTPFPTVTKQYYQSIINSIKKQNNLASKNQLVILQKIKQGNIQEIQVKKKKLIQGKYYKITPYYNSRLYKGISSINHKHEFEDINGYSYHFSDDEIDLLLKNKELQLVEIVTESRIGDLKNRFVGKILDEDEFNQIANIQVSKPIYTEWLINNYVKEFKSQGKNINDFLSVEPNQKIDFFEKNKSLFPNKDITSYSFNSLNKEIMKINQDIGPASQALSNADLDKLSKVGFKNLGNVSGYQIIKIPKGANSPQAWQVYKNIICQGRTQVCTASNYSRFEYYTTNDNFYLLVNHEDEAAPYHISRFTDQVKDKDDQDVTDQNILNIASKLK